MPATNRRFGESRSTVPAGTRRSVRGRRNRRTAVNAFGGNIADLSRDQLRRTEALHFPQGILTLLKSARNTPSSAQAAGELRAGPNVPWSDVSECPKSHKKPIAKLSALSDDFSSDCL